MKTLYYYMPPCPKCGSERTGRYMVKPIVNPNYTIIESLKNGEIVKLKKREPEKNAFCVDCGFEWHEQPRTVRITRDEKEDEIARRHTDVMLQEFLEKNNIDLDKTNPLGGFFSGFVHFF